MLQRETECNKVHREKEQSEKESGELQIKRDTKREREEKFRECFVKTK